jgi:hypothetical protein
VLEYELASHLQFTREVLMLNWVVLLHQKRHWSKSVTCAMEMNNSN